MKCFGHNANCKPIHGLAQPSNGGMSAVPFRSMPRKKGSKIITPQAQRLRKIVGGNIATLIDREFPIAKHQNVTAQQSALAKEVGSSLSSVQRIVKGEVGATMDLIADMAAALGVRPADLLSRNFTALAPTNDDDGGQELLQRRRS